MVQDPLHRIGHLNLLIHSLPRDVTTWGGFSKRGRCVANTRSPCRTRQKETSIALGRRTHAPSRWRTFYEIWTSPTGSCVLLAILGSWRCSEEGRPFDTQWQADRRVLEPNYSYCLRISYIQSIVTPNHNYTCMSTSDLKWSAHVPWDPRAREQTILSLR